MPRRFHSQRRLRFRPHRRFFTRVLHGVLHDRSHDGSLRSLPRRFVTYGPRRFFTPHAGNVENPVGTAVENLRGYARGEPRRNGCEEPPWERPWRTFVKNPREEPRYNPLECSET